MPSSPADRRTITEDLTRLLSALPAVMALPADDPMRDAWTSWKRALLGEIRVLEIRERHLAGSDELWTELNWEQSTAAGFGIDELRDTPIDHS